MRHHYRSHKSLLMIITMAFGVFLVLGISALIYWAQESQPTIWTVQPIETNLTTPEDIVLVQGPLVAPILYQGVVSLDALAIDEKKERFISLLLPAILVAQERQNQKLAKLDRVLAKKYPTGADELWIGKLKERYRASDIETLRKRLHTHPPSIVLAQAAIESGWGSSRFFLEAHNIFGVWSFNSNEPRIQAVGSRGGRPIYLRRYDSLAHSIDDYFRTLATSRSFGEFRYERLSTHDPLHLITFLGYYSEQREEYIRKLESVISFNDLAQYDSYQIDPQYYGWSSQ